MEQIPKISYFTNLYQLQKTLRFKLVPVENTKVTFEKRHILEKDKQRAADYLIVKKAIDEYHRGFIEKALSAENFIEKQEKPEDDFVSTVKSYAELYVKTQRNSEENDMLKELEARLRKIIANSFSNDSNKKTFGKLFKKQLITELLPQSDQEDEIKKKVESFKNYTVYFDGLNKARKNMYTDADNNTAIAHRCINDNLPKFLDNIRIFEKIERTDELKEKFGVIEENFKGIYDVKVSDMFSVDSFVFVLSQEGIERYNSILGGFVTEDGQHIYGLNQYINLYNQQVEKEDKSKRIPVLKTLYKQILSERSSLSFIPEKFNSDGEVVESIKAYFAERKDENDNKVFSVEDTLKYAEELINGLEWEDLIGIYVKNGFDLTSVSNSVYGAWDAVKTGWEIEYDDKHKVSNTEKYYENRKNAFKKIDSFTLTETERLAKKSCIESALIADVLVWLKNEIKEKCRPVIEKHTAFDNWSLKRHEAKLSEDGEAKGIIKETLDSVKEVERFLALLLGTGKEENKNDVFYGKILPLYERLSEIDWLYDKTRNYLTKKPFSTDKIALNFDCKKDFLNGWVESFTENSDNGTQYGGYLFRRKNGLGEYDYFIGVSSDSKLFRCFESVDKDDESEYERLDYYQPKGQSVYGSAYKGEKNYKDDKTEMMNAIIAFLSENEADKEIYKAIKSYSEDDIATPKGAVERIKNSSRDCYERLLHYAPFKESNQKIINALKATLLQMERAAGAKEMGNREYALFSDIIEDIDTLTTKKNYRYFAISKKELDSALNDENKPLYLFKITNKDLSYANTFAQGKRKSKGTENLHTMYFKLLMEGGYSVYDLGAGNIFYREASIPRKVTHPADCPVKNKNELNNKKASTFGYDLIKDRRYTEDQFMLHLSVLMNYDKPKKTNINLSVNHTIKNCKNNYVIGIDRGERNLLYITVTDENGKIAEQLSLNEIVNEYKGVCHKTDYRALLDEKEKDRLDARKNWTAIENIKDLKEGYISQVVHKICELVEKYDAIIAMEDLNSGFKNSRAAVEKSVYQKFEKMLIDKLNFYVNKKKEADEVGGALNAYQLTEKFESFKKMGKQNGFIFYVPAWLTSKIDPTTGFADLLKPKYTSVEAARDLISRFDGIVYNASEGYFEFRTDYAKFPKTDADMKKKWTICTCGKRIINFRNPEKNNEWDNEFIDDLSEKFKSLFAANNINVNGDIKAQILAKNGKEHALFFKKLISLIRLTLQMRNSETGTDVDYLISPVKNAEGKFYCSDDYKDMENAPLPKDADANGAYNIARKALWAVGQIKNCGDDLYKVKLAISNKDWLEYAQTNV